MSMQVCSGKSIVCPSEHVTVVYENFRGMVKDCPLCVVLSYKDQQQREFEEQILNLKLKEDETKYTDRLSAIRRVRTVIGDLREVFGRNWIKIVLKAVSFEMDSIQR